MTAHHVGQPLREVRLYGPLRAQFGRSHWLAVDSPAEAMHALAITLPGFKAAVLNHQGPGYRVLVGEGPQAHFRDAETLDLGVGSAAVIRVAPVMHGNKSGLGSIILGAVLMFVAPFAVGALLGKALILGGVAQLLSPQRKESGSPAKNETSYILNGVGQTASPGGPVPLIIGRVIVGSVPVSQGLSTDELQPAMPTPPPSPPLPEDQLYAPEESFPDWAFGKGALP